MPSPTVPDFEKELEEQDALFQREEEYPIQSHVAESLPENVLPKETREETSTASREGPVLCQNAVLNGEDRNVFS